MYRKILGLLIFVICMTLVTPVYAQHDQPVGMNVTDQGYQVPDPTFVAPKANPTTPLGTEGTFVAAATQVVPTIATQAESARLAKLGQLMNMPPADLQALAQDQIRFWDVLSAQQTKLGITIYKFNEETNSLEKVNPSPEAIAQSRPPEPPPGVIPRAWLPLLTQPGVTIPPPPGVELTSDAINRRIWDLYQYIDPLCKKDYTRGIAVCSEWGGAFPLTIVNNSYTDSAYPRMIGDYVGSTPPLQWPLGKITYFAIGKDFDFMDVEFEPRARQPWDYWSYPIKLWADRQYHTDGMVDYIVEVRQRTSDNIDLYLDNFKLLEDLSRPIPRIVVASGNHLSFPTLRYMGRIDTQTGRYIKGIIGFTQSTEMLGNMLYQYNYLPESPAPGWDYWYSIYGTYAYLSDDAYTLWETYPDCRLQNNGIDTIQPWGGTPERSENYYPYNSKVCLSLLGWDTAARRDNIMPPNVAIHILNKYNDPNHRYANPRTYGATSTSPREEARYLESIWNGYGIPNWARDAQLASALRTDNFWILETILGYKFDDPVSRQYADVVAQQFLYRIWGEEPFHDYTVYTMDWGELVRPNYRYSAFNFWKWKDGGIRYARPDSGIIKDLLDIVNMPQEVMDAGPIGVYEAAQADIQAARIFYYYKWNRTFDVSGLLLMPRYDIPLTGGLGNDIAIPWQTGWTARDLLNAINNQGGGATAIRKRWNGVYKQCTLSNCPDGGTGYYANFAIDPGAGYVVDVSYSIKFRVNGEPFSTTPTIPLKAGAYQQISVPVVHNVRGSLWASDIVQLLHEAGCGTVSVSKKDPGPPTSDNWQPYDQTGAVNNNFPVEMHKAYMVTVQNTCSLNP